METFLQTLISFPVAPFTVLLGIVLVYWVLVMVGALGVDALDLDADGALELDAAVEGGAKAAAEHHGEGFFSFLGLGGLPVTVAVSALAFMSWAVALVSTQLLAGLLTSTLLKVTLGAGICVASLIVGVLAARIVTLPLRRIFVSNEAPDRHAAIMGRLCEISSGSVDGRHGQATIEDGGAGLILNVFCGKANTLRKGDRAVVIDYDPAQDTYEIEPVEWLLPEELSQLEDPVRARAVAAAHRAR